jgi:hypothetical protein
LLDLQHSIALEDLAEHHAVGQILPRFVFTSDLCEGAGNNTLFYRLGYDTTPSASPNISSPVSIRTPPRQWVCSRLAPLQAID